jgi:hypothetical protein
MDRSDYDPYQDISPPFDPTADNKRPRHYDMIRSESELLDSHNGSMHKGPRPALTTASEAADFQVINWPDGPAFLRSSVIFDTVTFVIEGILVLTAIAFLSLAILACRWDGMPSDSRLAAGMEQAMKLVHLSLWVLVLLLLAWTNHATRDLPYILYSSRPLLAVR